MEEPTITMAQLFDGLKDELKEALLDIQKNVRASEVAEKHVKPIIDRISKNAGMEMDALFVAYLMEYVHSLAAAGDPEARAQLN